MEYYNKTRCREASRCLRPMCSVTYKKKHRYDDFPRHALHEKGFTKTQRLQPTGPQLGTRSGVSGAQDFEHAWSCPGRRSALLCSAPPRRPALPCPAVSCPSSFVGCSGFEFDIFVLLYLRTKNLLRILSNPKPEHSTGRAGTAGQARRGGFTRCGTGRGDEAQTGRGGSESGARRPGAVRSVGDLQSRPPERNNLPGCCFESTDILNSMEAEPRNTIIR